MKRRGFLMLDQLGNIDMVDFVVLCILFGAGLGGFIAIWAFSMMG